MMKFAGYDAIVAYAKADKPVYLWTQLQQALGIFENAL